MNLHWSWICLKGPTLFSVLGYCFSIWAPAVQPHMIDDVKTLAIEVYLENTIFSQFGFHPQPQKRGKLKFSKLLETVL